jgi:hypothetical protein
MSRVGLLVGTDVLVDKKNKLKLHQPHTGQPQPHTEAIMWRQREGTQLNNPTPRTRAQLAVVSEFVPDGLQVWDALPAMLEGRGC